MQTREKRQGPPVAPARKTVGAETPRCDADKHNLFFGDRLVHQFKHDARDQEALLAVFQAQGWPRLLKVGRRPKLRTWSKRRLHDTIQNLNRTLRGRLHFFQERSSELIGWQPGRRKSP